MTTCAACTNPTDTGPGTLTTVIDGHTLTFGACCLFNPAAGLAEMAV